MVWISFRLFLVFVKNHLTKLTKSLSSSQLGNLLGEASQMSVFEMSMNLNLWNKDKFCLSSGNVCSYISVTISGLTRCPPFLCLTWALVKHKFRLSV